MNFFSKLLNQVKRVTELIIIFKSSQYNRKKVQICYFEKLQNKISQLSLVIHKCWE